MALNIADLFSQFRAIEAKYNADKSDLDKMNELKEELARIQGEKKEVEVKLMNKDELVKHLNESIQTKDLEITSLKEALKKADVNRKKELELGETALADMNKIRSVFVSMKEQMDWFRDSVPLDILDDHSQQFKLRLGALSFDTFKDSWYPSEEKAGSNQPSLEISDASPKVGCTKDAGPTLSTQKDMDVLVWTDHFNVLKRKSAVSAASVVISEGNSKDEEDIESAEEADKDSDYCPPSEGGDESVDMDCENLGAAVIDDDEWKDAQPGMKLPIIGDIVRAERLRHVVKKDGIRFALCPGDNCVRKFKVDYPDRINYHNLNKHVKSNHGGYPEILMPDGPQSKKSKKASKGKKSSKVSSSKSK
ncbi:hypothetical protein HDE_02606 [Halotydeus destructor]|nr:hypothetical protein HDE_02606 [Halotydeus destructor]